MVPVSAAARPIIMDMLGRPADPAPGADEAVIMSILGPRRKRR